MPGRLEELRAQTDPVLTTLARGFTNPELVGTILAPIAYVPKESGKIPQFGKEAFKLYNTARAIRGASNRLAPEGISTIDFVLTEHDIEYPIDYREIEEAANVVDLEMHATTTVQNIILLRLEKEIADLVQDLNNYDPNHKTTLTGDDQWTSQTTSDPIGDIETAKEAIRTSIGRYPNVMLLGASAYAALKHHPALVERIKYTMKGIVTPELIGQIVDIPTVVVGKAVYSSDAGVFSDVWQDNCILAYVPDAPKTDGVERTPFEPAFAYTLRKKEMPKVDTYDTNGGKLHIVRCTDLLAVKLVGPEAGYIINDTNA